MTLLSGFGHLHYIWKKGFRYPELFLKQNTASEATMIRKSTWKVNGGFDESMRSGMEDYDFWLNAASHGIWGGTIRELLDW